MIYVSVVDQMAPGVHLATRDFRSRRRRDQEVLRVTRDTDPMQLVVGGQQHRRAKRHSRAPARGLAFPDLRPGPKVAFITLAERPTIVVDYTTDRAALQKNVNLIFAPAAEASTFLDGVAEISQGLTRRPPVRSIIVAIVTEGPDLSHRHYTQVLPALRAGGAALHAIVLKSGGAGGDIGVRTVLDRGTAESGGRYEEVLTGSALEAKLAQLAAELSNQYRVVYARPQTLIPPKSAVISVRQPELRARGMLQKTPAER